MVVKLKAGDALVQRGTIHNWVNRGTEDCVIAFVLISAKPATAAGKPLNSASDSRVRAAGSVRLDAGGLSPAFLGLQRPPCGRTRRPLAAIAVVGNVAVALHDVGHRRHLQRLADLGVELVRRSRPASCRARRTCPTSPAARSRAEVLHQRHVGGHRERLGAGEGQRAAPGRP